MGKTIICKDQKKLTDFSKWIKKKCIDADITQQDLAEVLHIAPPTICHKLQNYNFSLDEIIVIMNFFRKNITAEEIKELFMY